MRLEQAKRKTDWEIASEILLAAVKRLESSNIPLWTESEVSEDALKRSYLLEQLHLIFEEKNPVGMVFLQKTDPIFWSEETGGNSLFFHKLAIFPQYSGLEKVPWQSSSSLNMQLKMALNMSDWIVMIEKNLDHTIKPMVFLLLAKEQ